MHLYAKAGPERFVLFLELYIIIESLAELDLNNKLIQHSAMVQHILLRPSNIRCFIICTFQQACQATYA